MNAFVTTTLPEPETDDGPRLATPGHKPPPLKRDLVAGLEKGLAVIAAFDQERPRLTISEVAQRCELTRAAARRYLITLEHLGFVSCDRKMYALTAKVLRLGQSYMHSARLPRTVQPELHRLAHALKEASSAGVLDGGDVLCIAATAVGRVVSNTLQPGTRVPAYCTANGRVLVAGLPQTEVDAWIARQALLPLTPPHAHEPRTPAHRDRPRPRPGLRLCRPGAGTRSAHDLGAAEEFPRRGGGGIERQRPRQPGADGRTARPVLPALLHAQAQLRSLL